METINALARSQEVLGKELQRHLSNFKKDPSSRKNEQYYQDKIKSLDSVWEKIEENHSEIIKQGFPTHVYFTEKYYDQLFKIYNDAVTYINDKRNQSLSSGSNPATPAPLNRIKEEEVRINQLSQILDQTNDELKVEKSISRYQLLYKKISRQWETISEIYIELQVQGHSETINTLYEDTEVKYEGVMEALESKIRGQEISPPEQKSCNISLPQIKLPFFDGQYEEWVTFRDIFVKVVHENKSITQIEKMQYLKTHIRGEPSRLIQHLQISNVNYQTAWQILSDRYSNERLIISKLIDRILDIPVIRQESASKIKQLHDTIVECLEALKNINVDTASWSPIISRIIARKWDSETNKLYEQSLKEPLKVQDFVELKRFLQARFQSLETISDSPKIPAGKPGTSTDSRCKYCSQSSHTIYSCTKFQALSPSVRLKIVREKKLCVNCLNHDDNTACTSTSRCRVCKKAHHTYVHIDLNQNRNRPIRSPGDIHSHLRGNRNQGQTTNHASRKDEMVLLATALTKVKKAQGDYEYLRVLIDSGSQSSFITEEAAGLLALPRKKVRVEISGLGARDTQTAKWQIETSIRPRFPSKFLLDVVLLVLPKLTQILPGKPLDVNISQWNNDVVADPTFQMPGPIDIILGAKEYAQILLEGVRKTNNGILGQNTELGWIFSGNTGANKDLRLQVLTVTTGIEEDLQLTKFWEIEEVSNTRQMTEDEQICEEKYALNTTRDKDGTYTVRIPFNGKEQTLGISKQRAAARLIQLEKKLVRDEELDYDYKQFMQDYLDLGHMKLCVGKEIEFSKYYIPHHYVLKESSTTTKLRVVFDASSKTSSGVSLNETMYTGPKLQQELSDILLRWRSHKIVITADIEKMYRQIKIHSDDQRFQRILWRFDTKYPMQEYCLNTVTYGTTAAPYLAIKTLQQLASDEATKFPKAAKVALQDFYVDDLLSGADTLEETLELQSELIKMFRSGGFTLRKWSSNRNELLRALPNELKDSSSVEITKDETKKSLGIHWAPHDDTFRFKTEITEHSRITKRNILSEVAKLFDPLGWLAPVIIKAKLLVQELWLQELRWDDPVPIHIQTKWKNFQLELKNVEQLTISRWTHQSKQSYTEIHGFCDASEKAYGAVIYLKRTNPQNEVRVTLLTAKSKVAPARMKATLPRLELCAAVLLSKLIKRTMLALSLESVPVYAYSDSMITLSWIKGEPSRWKNFVANRVGEINKLLSSECWHHVKSEENPADVISRGLEPSKLKEYTPWWHGPSWLLVKEHSLTKDPVIIPATTEEAKVCYTVINTETNGGNEIIQRFSSLTRMIRVISYCKRFLDKCRKRQHPSQLTVNEMAITLLHIVKMDQKCYFQPEIKTLQKKKQLESKSKILSLNPFLDKDGILRVGGRLQHSQLPYNNRHPMVLAYRSHLARCVVTDAHLSTLHGGNQLTLAYIRKRFWIINGKNAVKNTVKHCIRCIRFKAQTAEQQMGDLPVSRVTPSHPFSNSGVDYAGPIQIKTSRGRGFKSYKGYIAIFVCLVTKAVHLEVVSDMSSDMFLAAFRRFTARRGPCANLYSDNGTNFVGASKILQAEIQETIQKSNIQDTLISAGTQWHFIPPSAPHFGGLWEAGVKSMKYHLKRVIGETRLTFEELSTLTHQIEACLNSRPLCPLSNDPEDLAVLTPGHFLIGRELISPPDPVTMNINSNLNERWKLVQKIKRDFWKSWSNNYLHQLQQRYKWKRPQEALQVGELVLIKEDVNPSKWPLARITEVFPTNDKSVRVVTVRKADGHDMKRPIHKLIPLSIQTSSVKEEHKEAKSRKHEIKLRSSHLWRIAMIAILFMTTLRSAIAQNYTIHYPEPGIFIEHIGHAKIDRGNFRIEIKFEKSKISNDTSNVALAIKQLTNLCRDAKELATASQCTSLIHHLREKESQLLWIEKGMEAVVTKRVKRGLLGKFLTSIFGVNEEVYMNIDELDKNQRELIKASNHQTKFMLHALATFNETETRITFTLEHSK